MTDWGKEIVDAILKVGGEAESSVAPTLQTKIILSLQQWIWWHTDGGLKYRRSHYACDIGKFHDGLIETSREILRELQGVKIMAGNLPDGVTTSMIPGNRPEDEEFERQLEDLVNEVQTLFTQYWEPVVDEFISQFIETKGKL